jgi:hypothetical protein
MCEDTVKRGDSMRFGAWWWVGVLALAGGCYDGVPSKAGDSGTDTSDTSETPDDTVEAPAAPTVRIGTAAPRTDVDLVAEIVGADPSLTYRWVWTVDGVAVPDLVTDTVPADRTRKGERWEAAVYAAADGVEGPPGRASVTIVNSAPTVTVVIDNAAPTTLDGLNALATPIDADGDAITLRWRWTADGAPVAVTTGDVPAGLMLRGQTWVVTVTPSDGDEDGTPATASVVIANAAPRVLSAALSPTNVRTNGTLQLQVGRDDADGDPMSNRIVWRVDGVDLVNQTGTSLPGSFFDRGQQVVAEVRVSDGTVLSDPVLSNVVTVSNTPPDLLSATLQPTVATAVTPLTCLGAGFADIDGDAEGYRYAWAIDGLPVAGETSATLSAGYGRGDTVTCTAIAFDGTDEGTASTSAPVVIGNTAPSVGSVSLSDLAPEEGETVVATANDIVDADGDVVTLTYRWYVNNALAGLGTSLAPTAFRAGDTLYAEVTPTDGLNAGAATRSPLAAVGNTPPTCTTLQISPVSPATADDVTAFAFGTDVDGQQVTFQYIFSVDGAIVQSGSSGTLSASLFARDDVLVVEARPFDGFAYGPGCTPVQVVVRNTAPTNGLVAITPTDLTVRSGATCTGSSSVDADGDAVGWTYSWVVNGLTVGTGPTLFAPTFARGDVLRCIGTASDGTASASPVTSAAVVVANAPPSLVSVAITPAVPGTQEALTAVLGIASDADSDPVTVTVRWWVDGVDSGRTGTTFPAGLLAQGQEVVAIATPNDGLVDGASVTSSPVSVGNALPVLGDVQITPTDPLGDDVLTVTWYAEDADGDALTTAITWTVDGVVVPVTGETLDPSFFARDSEISAAVSVSDPFVTVGPVSSQTVRIGNLAPTIPYVTVTPLVAYETSTLTCLPGPATDPEGDLVEVFYLWRVNGLYATENPTINGLRFRKGDVVTCAVAASDGYLNGLGPVVESAPITILNTPPYVGSAQISPNGPTEASTLTVATAGAGDVDFDVVTYRYAWKVNGVTVGSAATLTAASFSKGNTIQVVVTPFDGTEEGTSVSSNVLVALNTAPSAQTVGLTPSAPAVGDPVAATPFGSDVDGDPLTWTYVWYVNGVSVQSGATASLSPTFYGSGDTIYVVATANDGEASSLPVSSATIRVNNTPPSMTSAAITPTVAYESTTLTCVPSGWFDVDGDPPGYQYRWFIDGVADAATSTINGTRFGKGDVVTCQVTPFDGSSAGPSVVSNAVTVLNSPPSGGTATLDRLNPVETTSVGVVFNGVSDPDLDPLTYVYRWYVNGTLVSSATRIDGAVFSRGDTLRAEVDVSDGEAQITLSTNTVTVINSRPVVTSVTLSPEDPTTLDAVLATVAGTDGDGDPLTWSYAWKLNGVAVSGLDAATLPESAFGKNTDIMVVVTANDGIEASLPLTSDTIRSVNTPPVVTSVSFGPTTFNRLSGDLTCVAAGLSDVDGDTVVVRYTWFINGVGVTSSSTLPASSVARNDVVQCTATGYDGEDEGNAVSSSTATAGNAPPRILSASLSSAGPRETDTVSVTSIQTSDPDGDPVSWTVAWEVNGAVVSSAPTLDGNFFGRGDVIRALLTPSDGIDTGSVYTLGPITAINSAPARPGAVTLTPDTLYATSSLSVSGGASTDPDGDPVTVVWTFFVNGVAVQTGAGTSLPAGSFVRGDSVWVTAVASDGALSSTVRQTTTVLVQNSPPSVPSLQITPAVPVVRVDDITCTRTTSSTDVDGDTVNYQLRWRRTRPTADEYGAGGAPPNALVLPASFVNQGEEWICEVRMNDGYGWSAWSAPTALQLLTAARSSCADVAAAGSSISAVVTLDDGGVPWAASCEQGLAGGGWTRLLATVGADDDLGQATWSLGAATGTPGGTDGAWEPAFDHLRGFSELLIRATSGPQAGAWAALALDEPVAGLTLREVLEACRDEAPQPYAPYAYAWPASLGPTAAYSGVRVAGALRAVDPWTGGLASVDFVTLCGVVHGVQPGFVSLAMTTEPLDALPPGRWGSREVPGTLWAYAGADAAAGGPLYLGTPATTAGAGWRGVGAAAAYHEAAYVLYAR